MYTLAVRSIYPDCDHYGDRACSQLTKFLKTLNMTDQFVFIGHAGKIPAKHFIRSERGFTTRPQGNKHTGDDSRIGLQFNAVMVVTEQMSTAKNMLKEPKENLYCPAMLEN